MYHPTAIYKSRLTGVGGESEAVKFSIVLGYCVQREITTNAVEGVREVKFDDGMSNRK